jgi:hypothetical protein
MQRKPTSLLRPRTAAPGHLDPSAEHATPGRHPPVKPPFAAKRPTPAIDGPRRAIDRQPPPQIPAASQKSPPTNQTADKGRAGWGSVRRRRKRRGPCVRVMTASSAAGRNLAVNPDRAALGIPGRPGRGSAQGAGEPSPSPPCRPHHAGRREARPCRPHHAGRREARPDRPHHTGRREARRPDRPHHTRRRETRNATPPPPRATPADTKRTSTTPDADRRTAKPTLRNAALLLFSSTPDFAISTPLKKAAKPIRRDPRPHLRRAAVLFFPSTPEFRTPAPLKKTATPI